MVATEHGRALYGGVAGREKLAASTVSLVPGCYTALIIPYTDRSEVPCYVHGA